MRPSFSLSRIIDENLSLANKAASRMHKIWIAGFTLIATLAPAVAASPLGNWLVEEKTAQVRIVDCGSVLWGVFSWEKNPGLDTNNPDPALRNKPLVGSALLRGMKPNAGGTEWEGKVYNPEDGKLYDAKVSLADDNTLNLKGCLLSFLCKTVPWTRVAEAPPPAAKMAPKKTSSPGLPKTIDYQKDPDAEICSVIPGAAPAPAVGGGLPRAAH